MVQPYLLERKWTTKGYLRVLKSLLNVAVANAFAVYSSRKKTCHLTYVLGLIKAPIHTNKPQGTSPTGSRRQSVVHPPECLLGRYFTGKIPRTWRKQSCKEAILFVRYRIKGRSKFIGVLAGKWAWTWTPVLSCFTPSWSVNLLVTTEALI